MDLQLRSKLHDLEEYFHGSLKSAYLFKQTGICYKGKNVSSVAFKFGHSKRPREGFDASVLIALYWFRVLGYIYILDLSLG